MNLYVPTRRRPLSHFDFTPGPFKWLDAASIFVYLFMMFGVGFLAAPLLMNLLDQGMSMDALGFWVNAAIYLVTGLVMWFAAGKDFIRSMPGKKSFSPAHLAWVPAAWIANLVIAAAGAFAAGGLESSANQIGIEAMTEAVPLWAMFPVIALLGPFVEEYLFRHLLIGKLSRKLHRIKGIKWYLVVVSALVFASIHFVGGGDFRLQTLVPYLSLGLVISTLYVLMRNSLFMSWALHAWQNGVALILLYSIGPELTQMQ